MFQCQSNYLSDLSITFHDIKLKFSYKHYKNSFTITDTTTSNDCLKSIVNLFFFSEFRVRHETSGLQIYFQSQKLQIHTLWSFDFSELSYIRRFSNNKMARSLPEFENSKIEFGKVGIWRRLRVFKTEEGKVWLRLNDLSEQWRPVFIGPGRRIDPFVIIILLY